MSDEKKARPEGVMSEAMLRLSRTDETISAFIRMVVSTGRKWDTAAAEELIAHMAQRHAELFAAHVRLVSLTPMPPLILDRQRRKP